MCVLKVLIYLDTFFCSLLGFSSPWIANTQPSILRKLLFNFIYIILLLWFYFSQGLPLFASYYNLMVTAVCNSIVLASLIELYVITYAFGLHTTRISGFFLDLFGQEGDVYKRQELDPPASIFLTQINF